MNPRANKGHDESMVRVKVSKEEEEEWPLSVDGIYGHSCAITRITQRVQ